MSWTFVQFRLCSLSVTSTGSLVCTASSTSDSDSTSFAFSSVYSAIIRPLDEFEGSPYTEVRPDTEFTAMRLCFSRDNFRLSVVSVTTYVLSN